MLPAAATPIRVTRTAVMMELMTAAAMLIRATAPSAATTRPSPVEAAPPPEDADPGLHMVVPFRASWPSVTSPLTQRGGAGPGGGTPIRVCLVGLGRRERPCGGMGRKAEEELIVELSATTTTPRNALRWTRSRLKVYRTCPNRT